jgi:copper chaperone
MIELKIPDMSCGHCVGVVPKAVVEVDLASRSVRVTTVADRATLAAALAEEGYAPAAG